jgi:hypothetical protein
VNRNETKVWLLYHGSVFAEFQAWFDSHTKPARAIYFESATKALKRVELMDAQAATDRMLAGECKRPWRDEDVVAAIVAEAGKVSSQRFAKDHHRIDGQETSDCPYCDAGWVECWQSDRVHRMAVLCSCRRGDRIAEHLAAERRIEVQRFDPAKCYKVGDENWKHVP